jgi:hypothetical protein
VAFFAIHVGKQGEAATVAKVAGAVVKLVGACGQSGSLGRSGNAEALVPPIQCSESAIIVKFNILNKCKLIFYEQNALTRIPAGTSLVAAVQSSG